MKKITPHLWFDKEAKEAAEFYVSLFPESEVTNVSVIRDTPSGDCDVVSFKLAGQPFMAISAGPLFKLNPSVSFLVACKTKDEVDQLWRKLSEKGSALMELSQYPFSEKYGWVQDRYGLSWQIMFMGDMPVDQKITPVLMFVGNVCGKAEEAINFYMSVFSSAKNAIGPSKVGDIMRYGKGQEPDKEGTAAFASFSLTGQKFAAMDSAREHSFAFNEAVSFMVYCDTQEDIDYFWEKFSAVPEAEQCGWLKDKYGVSWQIVPTVMNEMMQSKDKEALARVTQVFLKMKKFDIAALEKAYRGNMQPE